MSQPSAWTNPPLITEFENPADGPRPTAYDDPRKKIEANTTHTKTKFSSDIDSLRRRRTLYTRKRLSGSESLTGMSEVDAKIAAAEARTDTKFAEMMGELRLIRSDFSTRLDHVEKSTSGIKTTVVSTGIVTGIAVIGLVVGIATWGSQMFGVGMDADSIARQAAQSVRQDTTSQINALDARHERLENSIGLLIEEFRSQQTAPQQQGEQEGPSAEPLGLGEQ